MPPRRKKAKNKTDKNPDDELSKSNSEMIRKIEKIRVLEKTLVVMQKFKELDADGTGYLDWEEFRQLSSCVRELERLTEKQMRKAFNIMDEDQSGHVSLEEFKMFCHQMLKTALKSQNPYPQDKLEDLDGIPWLQKYFYMVLFGGDTIEENAAIRRKYPETMLVGGVLAFCVVVSTIAFMLESMPELQSDEHKKVFLGIEVFVCCVFTIEYIMRLMVVRYRVAFIWSFPAVVDLVSSLPVWIFLIFADSLDWDDRTSQLISALRTLRLMRILRISRWESLENYFQIYHDMMKLAKTSIVMLLLLIMMSVFITSALTFVAEQKIIEDMETGEKTMVNETFANLFQTFYWCLVTQTTLGYGDIYPTSTGGQFMTLITTAIGLLNITFTINIIGSCFDEAFTRFLEHEEEKLMLQIKLIDELEMTNDAPQSGQITSLPDQRKMCWCLFPPKPAITSTDETQINMTANIKQDKAQTVESEKKSPESDAGKEDPVDVLKKNCDGMLEKCSALIPLLHGCKDDQSTKANLSKIHNLIKELASNSGIDPNGRSYPTAVGV